MSYCKYLCKNGEIYGIHVILTARNDMDSANIQNI